MLISKKLLLSVGMFVLLVALSGGVLSGCSLAPAKGISGSWRDYRDAHSLLAASERIVLATYLEEKSLELPTVISDDGDVIGSVTEIFRRFRVMEPLKGDAQTGDIQYVVSSSQVKSAKSSGGYNLLRYDVVQLKANEQYVLFLRSRAAPSRYPSEYGKTIWVRPGEPGIAQIDSEGRLTFIATDRYKNTIEEEGLERVEGSDAPFEMIKEDITGSMS